MRFGRARDGRTGGRTGGRLPRSRRHPGRPPLGHDHTVAAEGGDGADDGAEVARVGDAVERDDQRVLAVVERGGGQVVGVRVLVRRDLEDQALVVAGPSSSGPARAWAPPSDGCRRVSPASAHGLAHAVVVVDELLHVQGGRRHALAQRLEDGVAADDQLGGCSCRRPCAADAPCARRALACAARCLACPLRISAGGVGPLPSRPRRRLPPLPTCGALLVGRAPVGALAVPGHRGHLLLCCFARRGAGRARMLPSAHYRGGAGRTEEVDLHSLVQRAGERRRGRAQCWPAPPPSSQRGPDGVSSMTSPACFSSSRMASAVA